VPVAPAKALELSSAHPAVQATDGCAANSLTDHLPAAGQRDAVTFALAAIAEAPPPPADNPPPRLRPTLSIVRAVVDTCTTAREWLAQACFLQSPKRCPLIQRQPAEWPPAIVFPSVADTPHPG
jgi:hypothetical protein